MIGAGGVERMVELKLTKRAECASTSSVDAVQELVEVCKKLQRAAKSKARPLRPGDHRFT